MIDDVKEMLQQLIKMGARFESLSTQVDRMHERQILLGERLSKLEERLETINESARSAAQVGVAQLKADLTERITRLEMDSPAIESSKRYEDAQG